MCGLFFLYNNNFSSDTLTTLGRRALSLMVHRGPDDGEVFIDQPWAMGHRRLAIIDLDGSKQPMRDPTGQYVLSFNGEIYNFQELRDELQVHWQFKTTGDTEVILAGLVCHGENFIKKMDGMWALSFWDSSSQSLLLSRDRMGKKPLYFECKQRSMACASELPVLIEVLETQPIENTNSVADYFRYGYFLPGTTIYENVHEVLPGYNLVWRPGQAVKTFPYWQLNPVVSYASKQQAYDSLEEAMIEAVGKRMLASDVEVGAFLSGGVDSSLIVSIMCKQHSIRPKTFTIGFEEEAYDETKYAWQIAKEFDTDHYEEKMTQWDRDLLLKIILNNIGQPFYDPSILPTAKVSALASKHVKVVLSGDGGDELFCGYQRYQARVILSWFTRLPDALKSSALKVIGMLPEPMVHHSRSILKKAHLFANIVSRQEAETPYIAPVHYSKGDFCQLVPDIYKNGHSAPGIPEETQLDDISRMMVADSLVYLPQDILLKVDRASMAYSLETRAPFLDTKVIETAFSMPRKWHRHGFSGKRALKGAFKNYLPDNIWNRNKQGFAVPIYEWIRGDIGNQLMSFLECVDSPLNIQFVKQMLKEHRQKHRDHSYSLWTIYVYLLWKHKQ